MDVVKESIEEKVEETNEYIEALRKEELKAIWNNLNEEVIS